MAPTPPAAALRPPRAWQRWLQRLAWSQPGSWFFSRTLHYLDIPLLRLSRGRLAMPAILTGLPVISLTTTGARSGRPRTMPVVAMADGDKLVVIASNWGRRKHPAWYHNLRAHPEAMVTVDGHIGSYVAREVGGEERERYWRRATQLYPGYQAYERRAGGRKIPVLVLEPT